MVLTPTYHVMEMYSVHQDATLIPVDVHSNDYTLGNEKLPAITVSASKDKTGTTHISLVNIDAHKTQEITLDTRGQAYKALTGKLLTSAKLQDYNSFAKPNTIKPVDFKGASLKNNTISVKLPPFSVVVLELK